MNALGFIGGFFPLVVLVLIIVGIVSLVRRKGKDQEEPGIGTVRRIYYYGLSFVALMLAANGIVLLISNLADLISGENVISGGEIELALGLALTLVGTPVWLVFWNLARRSVREFPAETRSLARKGYIYLVLAVSLSIAVVGFTSFLTRLLELSSFEANPIASFIVWGGLFAFHWRIESLEGQTSDLVKSVRRLYVYLASLLGLVLLTVGISTVLFLFLREAYDALFTTTAFLRRDSGLWNDTMRNGIAMAIVGGPVWWWHWYRVSRGDTESVLRQVYLHLFAILGGAITVVVSLSVLIFRLLEWGIGGPELSGAAVHFGFLSGTIAALVTGGGLWGYHWSIARSEARITAGRLLAARRVYRHVMAALGLATLAVGLVFLFSLFLDLVVPQGREEFIGTDWWRGSLALTITLLMVGAPLWGYYWLGAQREVLMRASEERTALSRRVFIYTTFGISILATLGSLSFVLYSLFQGMLEGSISLEIFRNVKWGIGVLLTAGTISVYYWLVLKADRKALPPVPEEAPTPPPTIQKEVTVLATDEALPIVRRLEARLGYAVSLRQRQDAGAGIPILTDEELESVLERIAQAPSAKVMLTIDASGVQVIPFDEA